MNDDTKNLPITIDNGFDAADRSSDRIIRGTIVRCVDGNWSDADGAKVPAGTQLLAWAMTEALQLWRNKLPVEAIIKQPGTSLPDIDELNSDIPREQWELGLNGPRPPWVKQHIVYLLNPIDGSELTFISSTTGAAIATERLHDRVRNMRMLRGSQVVPLVELGNAPMPTKFGTKLRPDFVIVEWRNLGGPAIPAQAPALIGTKVDEPTYEEVLNDSIPESFR
jgi:hypothetical protein